VQVCKNGKASSDYKCSQYQRSRSDPLAKTSFVSIAQSLEGFLTTFQSPAPLAPFLSDDIMELVKGLMLRCIKTEVIERLNTASELMKVDLETNLVPMKKLLLECLLNHCCRNQRHGN